MSANRIDDSSETSGRTVKLEPQPGLRLVRLGERSAGAGVPFR
jgi:hypothetical protein